MDCQWSHQAASVKNAAVPATNIPPQTSSCQFRGYGQPIGERGRDKGFLGDGHLQRGNVCPLWRPTWCCTSTKVVRCWCSRNWILLWRAVCANIKGGPGRPSIENPMDLNTCHPLDRYICLCGGHGQRFPRQTRGLTGKLCCGQRWQSCYPASECAQSYVKPDLPTKKEDQDLLAGVQDVHGQGVIRMTRRSTTKYLQTQSVAPFETKRAKVGVLMGQKFAISSTYFTSAPEVTLCMKSSSKVDTNPHCTSHRTHHQFMEPTWCGT